MQLVIIGSGIAGVTFAEKYRSLVPEASITLISRENEGYYSRPLLSRGFTKADIESSIILKSFDTLRANGLNILSGAEVEAIDRIKQCLDISVAGLRQTMAYDKLIIATGSAAFIPPVYQTYRELFYCLNSLDDLIKLRQLRAKIQSKQQAVHWAVIGGGLIGCELASDLAVAGDQVTLYHATDRLMERQLVAEDSALLVQVLETTGVKVLFKQNISQLQRHAEQVFISSDHDQTFDAVVVACGFKPRTQLAEQAGLACGRGITVNAFLQTEDQHIFALGDVAQLPDGKLYPFILPIRSQANWLATYLSGQTHAPWEAPLFTTKAKVHGFEAQHPYLL